jgi:hypothetical protein
MKERCPQEPVRVPKKGWADFMSQQKKIPSGYLT